MAMIRKDRLTHSIVLIVNIDSPKNHHVKTGNTRYDIAKAKNLTLHADSPKAAYPSLVPKYARTVVGTAKAIATIKLLLARGVFINCRFVLNHTAI